MIEIHEVDRTWFLFESYQIVLLKVLTNEIIIQATDAGAVIAGLCFGPCLPGYSLFSRMKILSNKNAQTQS